MSGSGSRLVVFADGVGGGCFVTVLDVGRVRLRRTVAVGVGTAAAGAASSAEGAGALLAFDAADPASVDSIGAGPDAAAEMRSGSPATVGGSARRRNATPSPPSAKPPRASASHTRERDAGFADGSCCQAPSVLAEGAGRDLSAGMRSGDEG